jgi:urea carboxylase
LRFFDQLRFFPVSAEELLDARERFPNGKYPLRVEETTFSLREYLDFLKSIESETAAFRAHQKEAFDAERERWRAAGQMTIVEPEEMPPDEAGSAVPEGCEGVSSPMTASVFQIVVEPGQTVAAGQKLVILDAMKTEIGIESHVAGVVEQIHCTAGSLAQSGQLLVSVRPSE